MNASRTGLGLIYWVALCQSGISAADLWNQTDLKPLADQVVTICGGRIDPLPKLLVLNSAEFNKAISSNVAVSKPIANQRLFESVATIFFAPQENQIVLLKGQREYENIARTTAEVGEIRRMLLLHELVHAWQYQNLDVAALEKSNDPLVRHTLLEGHAMYVIGQYSRRRGTQQLFNRMLKGYSGKGELRTGAFHLDVEYVYEDAYHFFRNLAERPEALGFKDIVQQGLPDQHQIFFPDEYVAGSRRPRVDLRWCKALIDRPTVETSFSEIGYVPLRRYCQRLPIQEQRRREILASFCNGMRIGSGSKQLTVLAFDDSSAAKSLFGGAKNDHARRSRQPVFTAFLSEAPDVRYAAHRIDLGKAGRRVATLLALDQDRVIELNEFGEAPWALPIEQSAKVTARAYLELQKQHAATGARRASSQALE